jgi:LPPG:FO 2-phospho-L-lactate transferase
VSRRPITVITGGVGGAKLAEGLYHLLPPDSLTLVVNTGDDFEHLGLRICPDLDTTLYTLAGLSNRTLGWGREGETWAFMDTLTRLGGESWFRLGDNDLALHVQRTQLLAGGVGLSDIIDAFSKALGVTARILPMTDDRVATIVSTSDGELDFQDYFVRLRCEPAVNGLRFAGAGTATATSAVLAALGSADSAAIVIAPSNPYLSIDPILAIPEIRAALASARVPVIAVTPIINGKAVKGPTAKIMAELGLNASPIQVAKHYDGLIDGFILDSRDQDLAALFDIPVKIVDTLMTTLDDKKRVGAAALDFAGTLTKRRSR